MQKRASQEIEAFQIRGISWWTDDAPCDATPVSRNSEMTDPPPGDDGDLSGEWWPAVLHDIRHR
jgi:hypothetical protein